MNDQERAEHLEGFKSLHPYLGKYTYDGKKRYLKSGFKSGLEVSIGITKNDISVRLVFQGQMYGRAQKIREIITHHPAYQSLISQKPEIKKAKSRETLLVSRNVNWDAKETDLESSLLNTWLVFDHLRNELLDNDGYGIARKSLYFEG